MTIYEYGLKDTPPTIKVEFVAEETDYLLAVYELLASNVKDAAVRNDWEASRDLSEAASEMKVAIEKLVSKLEEGKDESGDSDGTTD